MGREGRDTEWKESWSKDNLKTISAMHNIAGGIMIIGKTDSGNVCGISESEAERLLKAVPDTIRNTLDITVDVYIKEENKKLCLYIEVEKGDRIIDYDGKFYKRSGSTTHLMRREELKAIVMTESGKYWMEHPSEVGCSEDISEEAIEYFVNKGKSARRLPGSLNANDADGILKRFDMLYPDGKISVTGAVMFGKRPSKLLGGAFLKIGEFDNKGELLREDYVEGPLIMLPDAAMKALYEKYTQGRFDYSDVARKIKYRYPTEAVREGILNSLTHKDYTYQEPVTIRVYPDRVVLYNFGPLPPGWTVNDLSRPHESVRRNKVMAEVFHEAGFVETWGKGIRKIFEECEKNGNPRPIFEVRQDGLALTFLSNDHDVSGIIGAIIKEEKINKTQVEVLRMIAEDPTVTAADISKALNKTERGILKSISDLSDRGIVRRDGGRKDGIWTILPR